MQYNLTESQKNLARFIVKETRAGNLPETFLATTGMGWRYVYIRELNVTKDSTNKTRVPEIPDLKIPIQFFDVLAASEFIYLVQTETGARLCTVTGLLYKAVDSDFEEDAIENRPISTLASPHPPEIAMSLDRLRAKYPDPKKLGFLIMRFAAAKPFGKIVDIIKRTAEEHGIIVVRADEAEFHGELWGNVRTYLHGCGFGIAVYERIETNEPNANVGLEVGYLMAMNKPVLLLKDKTVETLQADLAGKLYKNFDPHDPEATIPDQLTKWLIDYGIVVPKHIPLSL